MTQPASSRPPFTGPTTTRLLRLVAALCFFFAAITVAGENIADGPAWAWGFGAFCAWMLSDALA